MTQPAPLAILIPGLRGRLLTVLVRASHPLSIRQLARRCRSSSPSAVRHALARLEADGLVRIDIDPDRGHFSELRRGQPLVQALRTIDEARNALPDRITDMLMTWQPAPRAAVLIGPAARGEAADAVDLLIVWAHARPSQWAYLHLRLRQAVQAAAGAPLVLHEWWTDDWNDAARAGDPIVATVASEGVRVQGQDLFLLTRGINPR